MICTDRPVDIGDNSWNRFAQGSYSRASTPSITIDAMDDDDEPSASHALSLKGDQTDLTRVSLSSEDSDDDIFQSVKSDDGDYVSLLPRGHHDVGWSFHVLLQMDVEYSPPQDDNRDLVQSINGMYRVLDLISEQGSGGLGDPIVLAEPSFADCS